MALRGSSGWQDLRAEDLSALEGDEFEEFCASLVKYEALDRHDEPEFDGGAGKYVSDGGRDLLLTIDRSPSQGKLAYQQQYHLKPLTEDPISGLAATRTAYSCKSGKWLDLALKDARSGAERAVDVLAEGGYFKLLINQLGRLDAKRKRGGVEKTPLEHLRGAFWDRLKLKDPSAPDPGPQIRIYDADAIAIFLRARQPEGGDMIRWMERLQLSPILRSLEEWRAAHVLDRQEPKLVDDDMRVDMRNELRDWIALPTLPVEERIACVVGQPGVGKTRLVIESLASHPATAQRVRVALSPQEARQAIESRGLLRRHPDLLLVIDDCLVAEARGITVLFLSAVKGESRARLLLLVPAAFEVVRTDLPANRVWALSPLDPKHAQIVVANEIGRPNDDTDVIAIARFSEGFPWFARLLAEEFKAAGRAPVDMREALRWALASERELNVENLRRIRARTLLAVSLTSSVDWDALTSENRQHLAQAVGLDKWDDVAVTALECEQRGILRRSLGWKFKYVTPQVLEREIIAWLLGPGGPDPGARTLSDFGAAYLEDFYATLARLGLPKDVVACIANVAFQQLRNADLSQIRSVSLLGARLRFLAHHRSGETARELRRIIEGCTVEELSERVAERRGLVWALDALSVSEESFEDAEAALFRLACSENESYANNATGTWAGLFLVELNPTHRSLGARLSLLEGRLSDADARARLVALVGVESVLTMHAMRMTSARGERSWLLPTSEEARDGRLRAWAMLCERLTDADALVARAARKLALKHLRAALRFGISRQVMDMLEVRANDFSLDERILLREKLEEIRAYDSEYLDPSDAQPARLEAAVAPRSFSERLRQRVGTWGPASLRDGDDGLDDALAREGLEDAVPLRAELGWLVTDAAQRAHVFAYAIGRCDIGGILFEDLRRVARENPRSWKAQALVARYLGGMAAVGRTEQADVFLCSMQANPDEATSAALALVELGATPDRLRWLEQALHDGLILEFGIAELGRRGQWLANVGEGQFLRLLHVMAAGGDEGCSSALDLFVGRYKSAPPQALDLLDQLLTQLAPSTVHASTNYRWQLGAKMLADSGGAARAAELAVVVLSRGEGSNDFAWKTLHHASERDPVGVFRAVARGLDAPGQGGHLLIAFWFHRASFAWPAAAVLEWVGDDERRARAAAGLVRVHDDTLPEILRELIRRFGPHGSVAREIMSRVHSTDGIVASLAEHARTQLIRARQWLCDPDPLVAEFASQLIRELEEDYERHAAYEQHARHQFGT
jgi:hypothetical protein